MQPQLRIFACGIGGDPDVGDDDRIGPDRGGNPDGVLPELELACRGKGVDGQQDLGLARMGIVDRFSQFVRREIQAGKIPRIGRILKTAIDRVCAGIDRGAEARRRTGRADEFGTAWHRVVIHGSFLSRRGFANAKPSLMLRRTADRRLW